MRNSPNILSTKINFKSEQMMDELDECSEIAIDTDDMNHYSIANRDGRLFRKPKRFTCRDSLLIALSVRFCNSEGKLPCIYRTAVRVYTSKNSTTL